MPDLTPQALATEWERLAAEIDADNVQYADANDRGHAERLRSCAAEVRNLAPAHAALEARAELAARVADDYAQRLAEALAGRPAVIDWTGPDEVAQATRDISQRVTGAFKEGVRLGVKAAEDNPGIRPYHAASVTREPVTVSQDAEAIAARLKILAAGRDQYRAGLEAIRDSSAASTLTLQAIAVRGLEGGRG